MGSIKMLSMDSHYWTLSGPTCVFSLDHYPHGRDPVFFLTLHVLHTVCIRIVYLYVGIGVVRVSDEHQGCNQGCKPNYSTICKDE